MLSLVGDLNYTGPMTMELEGKGHRLQVPTRLTNELLPHQQEVVLQLQKRTKTHSSPSAEPSLFFKYLFISMAFKIGPNVESDVLANLKDKTKGKVMFTGKHQPKLSDVIWAQIFNLSKVREGPTRTGKPVEIQTVSESPISADDSCLHDFFGRPLVSTHVYGHLGRYSLSSRSNIDEIICFFYQVG
ncbi:Holliday junction ATP-dependent DNA helicaseRuvA [Striga asiatica]|uniref:Holliday junction ATP-dependent DNA helicaseRuvA n=1 Tax=Striga asiatica TaxID=4170 RepID=A0A5A7R9C1_STRAF|nr:Holliday junction ATP-dependent DNA helicaseRuvA [Striga asiatica]